MTIRKWYQVIESKIDTYEIVKIYGNKGYYDTITNQIVKIVTSEIRDWYTDVHSYYFHNNALFFIFIDGCEGKEFYTASELGISEQELWQRGGEAKTHRFWQDRIYVVNNRCIRYLTKEKIVSVEIPNVDLAKVKNEVQDTSRAHSYLNYANPTFKEFYDWQNKNK